MPVFTWTLPPAVPLASPVPADEGTKDLFGYDIFIKDGMPQLTEGGDYARVSGEANIKAAIYRRLLTRPGEFRFRPSYGAGVGTFVKKPASKATLDSLERRIVEQLLQERRIQAVEVTIESASINGKPVLKVLVRATTGGRTQTFAPFTFSEEAAV